LHRYINWLFIQLEYHNRKRNTTTFQNNQHNHRCIVRSNSARGRRAPSQRYLWRYWNVVARGTALLARCGRRADVAAATIGSELTRHSRRVALGRVERVDVAPLYHTLALASTAHEALGKRALCGLVTFLCFRMRVALI
jgi:hypothetical protein